MKYIEIYPESNSIRISKDLVRSMKQSNSIFRKVNPKFVQIVRIARTNDFCIIPRKPSDTFKMQCSMCLPTGKRKTPYSFNLTIPSLEMISAFTGINFSQGKILKVTEIKIPSTNLIVYKICSK